MNTLCIVPCGKRKIWDKEPDAGPTIAKLVYTGPFAKKCREYAEMFHPDSWVILSAKYGFLFPDDLVSGPYEITFNKQKTNPITVRKLIEQAGAKGLTEYDRITILGGKQYVSIGRKVFPYKKIEAPLSGLSGIGMMMKRLNIAAQSGKSLV